MLLKLVQFALMGVFVIVYVSIKFPANRSTAPSKPPSIVEREVDGFAERSTGWWILSGFPTTEGQNVDWSVISNSHPAKPPFVFAMRSRTPRKPSWQGEAFLSVSLIVDEQPIELKGERSEHLDFGIGHTVIRFNLTKEDMLAIAGASSVAVEYAGQRVGLIARGLETCRELQL